MKLTPLDIHHKEFHRSIRGYNEEQVDKFLDEVAEEFERLFKENIELKEQIEKIKEDLDGYLGMEKTLHNTLLTAQKSAEEITIHSKKESELVLRDAELKAKEIIQEAYDLKHKYEATLNHLKQAEEEFRSKFKSMLESYMRIADSTAVLADIGNNITGFNDKPPFEEKQPLEDKQPFGEDKPVFELDKKYDVDRDLITSELEVPKIGIAKIEEDQDEAFDFLPSMPSNFIGETYVPDEFIPEAYPDANEPSFKNPVKELKREDLSKKDKPDFDSLAF